MNLKNKSLIVICLLVILLSTACSASDLLKPDINVEDTNITTDDAVEVTEDNFDSYYKDKLSEGISKKFFSGITETVENAKEFLKEVKEWFEDL